MYIYTYVCMYVCMYMHAKYDRKILSCPSRLVPSSLTPYPCPEPTLPSPTEEPKPTRRPWFVLESALQSLSFRASNDTWNCGFLRTIEVLLIYQTLTPKPSTLPTCVLTVGRHPRMRAQ